MFLAVKRVCFLIIHTAFDIFVLFFLNKYCYNLRQFQVDLLWYASGMCLDWGLLVLGNTSNPDSIREDFDPISRCLSIDLFSFLFVSLFFLLELRSLVDESVLVDCGYRNNFCMSICLEKFEWQVAFCFTRINVIFFWFLTDFSIVCGRGRNS